MAATRPESKRQSQKVPGRIEELPRGAYSRFRRLEIRRGPDAAAIRIGKHAGAMGATSSTMTSKLHSHILFF